MIKAGNTLKETYNFQAIDANIYLINKSYGPILFFAPIGLALVHGAVALTALSHLFGY